MSGKVTTSSAKSGRANQLLNTALAKARAGDLSGASDLLNDALKLEPENPAVLLGRAIIYRVEGQLRDAVLSCDAAIRVSPNFAEAWLERGTILASGGSPTSARESFARAVELAPRNATANANLAVMAARERDFTVARQAAQSALAIEPKNIDATFALATVLIEEKNPTEAAQILATAIEGAPYSLRRIQALSLLATAQEQLDDHASAFTYYSRSNEEFLKLSSSIAAGQPGATEIANAILEGFSAVPRSDWSSPPEEPRNTPNHIFLLGYPRSGTTLVENILASIDGVSALEERSTLMETDREFLLAPIEQIPQNIARFAKLGKEDVERLNKAYWQRAANSGMPGDTSHFVDMDPLKGTRLPFISKLFPDSRIVIMRRDPRDVVWSCFKTSFAVTSASLEFASLERTARHYDLLMQITALAQDRLDLKMHELRYEDLVSEFDNTTKALCEFAGLPWNTSVRDFSTTADRRGVATASTGQVRKGLYNGSSQWEPYQKWLQPVMPILQPWIERLGYD